MAKITENILEWAYNRKEFITAWNALKEMYDNHPAYYFDFYLYVLRGDKLPEEAKTYLINNKLMGPDGDLPDEIIAAIYYIKDDKIPEWYLKKGL